MKIFYPEQYADSVIDIDYKALYRAGVRLILFDVDNTLATYNRALPEPRIQALIQSLKKQGFEIVLVSNGGEHRVERFAAALGVHYVYRAMKPLPSGVCRVLQQRNVQKKEAVLVGDQVFTDVWAGNWAGIHTVLTRPISTVDDEWITKIKRGLESRVIARYLKKEGKKHE